MNKSLLIQIVAILFLFQYYSFHGANIINAEQVDAPQAPLFPEDLPGEDVELKNNTEQNTKKSKNINLDMEVLYGQYNQMFSSINLSQEGSGLVYLLRSDFNSSNDFGYNNIGYINSGFNENRMGITVSKNWTDIKMIIDGETDNDSRGMYDNDVYTREEKGENKIFAKAVYKINPSVEGHISVGEAWYRHSLVALNPYNHVKSRLLQGNANIGIEYIWSASNRISITSGLLYYDYRQEEDVNSDNHIDFEIIDDFSITTNIGLSIGVGYDINKDVDVIKYPLPRLSISLKGYKYFSTTILYRYDLVPFQPEEYYLMQKYIRPTFDLPPRKAHHGELKADFRINSMVNLKGNFNVEKDNDFYNYFPTTGNVLSADTIDVISYNTGIDANFLIYKKILKLALSYNYSYFDAKKNITYQADHNATGSIKFNGKKWKFEWSNKLKGKVYTNPENNETIPEVLIGTIGVQRIILEGSYFYGRVDNLYNNRYSLRKDYPEPGVSFLGGLRILI